MTRHVIHIETADLFSRFFLHYLFLQAKIKMLEVNLNMVFSFFLFVFFRSYYNCKPLFSGFGNFSNSLTMLVKIFLVTQICWLCYWKYSLYGVISPYLSFFLTKACLNMLAKWKERYIILLGWKLDVWFYNCWLDFTYISYIYFDVLHITSSLTWLVGLIFILQSKEMTHKGWC